MDALERHLDVVNLQERQFLYWNYTLPVEDVIPPSTTNSWPVM